MLAFYAWFYKYVHIRSYLEDISFKSMWFTVTLWYFRHYIFKSMWFTVTLWYFRHYIFKSMWFTVTLWYFRHYIFMYSSSLCWKPVLLNYLNNFHNYFAFIHNAYVFDWVIINVTKYSNPEYFENITLGSALHRRARHFATCNTLLPICWYFLHVLDFLINRYTLEGF